MKLFMVVRERLGGGGTNAPAWEEQNMAMMGRTWTHGNETSKNKHEIDDDILSPQHLRFLANQNQIYQRKKNEKNISLYTMEPPQRGDI